MASDGAYRIVHTWAEREGWWTNTAMARELLDELEKDRLKDVAILSRGQIISEEILACSRDRNQLLDRVADELTQDVWAYALRSKLVPLELPQVEQCDEDCGHRGIRITVSMRCKGKEG